jgi:hypothetical protein
MGIFYRKDKSFKTVVGGIAAIIGFIIILWFAVYTLIDVFSLS